jgi:hypothetical protein
MASIGAIPEVGAGWHEKRAIGLSVRPRTASPFATAAPAEAELCSSLGIVFFLAPARFGEHGAQLRASGWVRLFSDAVVAGLVALGRLRVC